MRIYGWILALGTVIGLTQSAAAQDCAEEVACEIDGGVYYAALPEKAEDAPMVLWLHGFNGRADRAVRRGGIAKNFLEAGYVFVAPQGTPDPDRPDLRDWAVRDAIPGDYRDDVVFLSAVIEDAAKRYGVDTSRVLLAGFSRGGSMAWDFACLAPERVYAVAAIAGGFWEPMTPDCAGPVHLFHTHGFTDGMVPFEGRQGMWEGNFLRQGDIMKGLEIWRATNGCLGRASSSTPGDPLWEKRWDNCDAGSITLQLHPGGHSIPRGWSMRALDWVAGLEGEQG